jgi:hypothetical protein
MGCAKCKLLFILYLQQTNWIEIGLQMGEKVWNHALHAVLYICKEKFMISRPNAYTQGMFLAYTPARVAPGYLFQYLFTSQPCLSVH